MFDNIALQHNQLWFLKKEKEISVCWKTLQVQVIFLFIKKEQNKREVKPHLNKNLL